MDGIRGPLSDDRALLAEGAFEFLLRNHDSSEGETVPARDLSRHFDCQW